MDTTSSKQLGDFHASIPKSVIVPDKLQIKAEVFSKQYKLVFIVRTADFISVMPICMYQRIHLVLFKGQMATGVWIWLLDSKNVKNNGNLSYVAALSMIMDMVQCLVCS
jgi:hypothetical protein